MNQECTIHDYLEQDKVDLACIGCPGYTLTKDGRIWSTRIRGGYWAKPAKQGHGSYTIYTPDKRAIHINADRLVSEFFIVPTMRQLPHMFKYHEPSGLWVSATGVIFDPHAGCFRNPSIGGRYAHVHGRGNYFNVHRLVAELFVPNPRPGIYDCVNHKDFNRLNNRAENLEWCTQAMNLEWSRENGRMDDADDYTQNNKHITKEVQGRMPFVTDMLVRADGRY